MKPNPEAIKALKRVMTKQQRKEFVKACINENGKDFLKNCDKDTVLMGDICDKNDLFHMKNSYRKISAYTEKVGEWYCKLTTEECKLKLFIDGKK